MSNWGYTTPGNGGFDAKDRLTNWQRSNGIDSQQWNLSLVDDWSSTTVNGIQELRGHNEAHELLTRDAVALTYDAKGNLTHQAKNSIPQNYTWDYNNKLVSAALSLLL